MTETNFDRTGIIGYDISALAKQIDKELEINKKLAAYKNEVVTATSASSANSTSIAKTENHIKKLIEAQENILNEYKSKQTVRENQFTDLQNKIKGYVTSDKLEEINKSIKRCENLIKEEQNKTENFISEKNKVISEFIINSDNKLSKNKATLQKITGDAEEVLKKGKTTISDLKKEYEETLEENDKLINKKIHEFSSKFIITELDFEKLKNKITEKIEKNDKREKDEKHQTEEKYHFNSNNKHNRAMHILTRYTAIMAFVALLFSIYSVFDEKIDKFFKKTLFTVKQELILASSNDKVIDYDEEELKNISKTVNSKEEGKTQPNLNLASDSSEPVKNDNELTPKNQIVSSPSTSSFPFYTDSSKVKCVLKLKETISQERLQEIVKLSTGMLKRKIREIEVPDSQLEKKILRNLIFADGGHFAKVGKSSDAYVVFSKCVYPRGRGRSINVESLWKKYPSFIYNYVMLEGRGFTRKSCSNVREEVEKLCDNDETKACIIINKTCSVDGFEE